MHAISDATPSTSGDQREERVPAAIPGRRHSVIDDITVGGPDQVGVNGHGSRARLLRTALGAA